MNGILRDIALSVAFSYVGRPYIWGGDDPSGFDCSGFVIEVYKSVGILPRSGDWTAQGLHEVFTGKMGTAPAKAGLVFYGEVDGNIVRHSKIVHVELCINDYLSIGASGGGRSTLTVKDAIDQNAFVKVRPMRSRNGIIGFVDPF
ncbi:MAG: C40 family peptidase [Deltaproteobacteria bacterium]|nr:C40 family peptidase [Deltaproteobacteria bacterium]